MEQPDATVDVMALFNPGDLVVLRGSDVEGVVRSRPQPLGSTVYYQVRFNDREEWCREGDLSRLAGDIENPVSWMTDAPLGDPDAIARRLTFLKLTCNFSDVIYSFGSTRTLFRVHQFKPVLKVIEQEEGRLLLADEVGLGKTIEAGLVWSELDARIGLSRVLVVCPSGLVDKWKTEMSRRFDRDLRVIGRREFLDFADLYHERGDASAITAVSTFGQLRHDDVLEALSERPPSFDLVIVDEAHAMRNPSTKTHHLGELLAANSFGLLLLTATPVNLGSNDLWNLLRLLRPDEFDDRELFGLQLQPNVHINRAVQVLRGTKPPDVARALDELRKVESGRLGTGFLENPVYRRIVGKLEEATSLSAREVVALSSDLQGLNTLNSVYVRTRRRELKDETTVRRAKRLDVHLTHLESEIYASTVELVAKLQQRRSGSPPGLAVVMPARQASSCLPVMRDYIKDLAIKSEVETGAREGLEEDPGRFGDTTYGAVEFESSLLDETDQIEALCAQLGDVDSKYDAFRTALESFFTEGNSKILAFSFFRRTLRYLAGRLTEDGIRCKVMDGSVKPADRSVIIDNFRNDDVQVLLCSQIGSEGLDFEFCSVVINYDLPWNPMQVEQRIGRIDRFGQKSAVVHVVNFNLPGTIDTDVFLRLYDRIRVFEESIGELEPIIGPTFHELNRELAKSTLTKDEQMALVDRLALAIEAERQSLEEFEEDRRRLVGVDDFIEGQIEDARNSNRYLTPVELRRYLEGFFKSECPGTTIMGSPGHEAIVGSPALGAILRRHMDRPPDPAVLSLIGHCEVGNSILASFNQSESLLHDREFIHNRHPLVRGVTAGYQDANRALPRAGLVELDARVLNKREWIFYIFRFETTGFGASRILFPVAVDRSDPSVVDRTVGEAVLAELATDSPRTIPEVDLPALYEAEVVAAFRATMTVVEEEIERLATDLKERADAYVSARVASLEVSRDAKEAQLWALVEAPNVDERIARMRRAQINNLRASVDARIAEFEARREVAVSFVPLMGGLVVSPVGRKR